MKILKFDINLLNAFGDFERLVQSARSKGFEAFEFEGNLNLFNSPITSLPDNITVGGNLNLYDCTSLKSLPDNLSVGGNLNLYGCTSLKSLPDNLSVGGNLDLYGCTSLKSLPDNLSVGGNLNLGGSGIKKVPKSVKVNGNILT